MKKRSVISGIMVLMFAALLSGCAKNTESSSNREEKDEGFIREENSKELVVASGWYISCTVDDGLGVYTPELQEGHGSLITADVDVYPSIYEIRDIKSFQTTTLEDIATRVNAPEIKRGEDYSDKHLLQYSDGDDRYYIIQHFHLVEVIKNGQEFMYYSSNSSMQDELEPFWVAVSAGSQGAGTMLTPVLTEDEILNMTDEEVIFYANLQYNGQLQDTSCIAYEAEGIRFEEGEGNNGFTVSPSDADVDEALENAVQKYVNEKKLYKERELTCIGDYLIRENNGIRFRRYFILGNNVDMDPQLYDGSLYVDEWFVSESGVIDHIRPLSITDPIRTIEGADKPFDMYE